MSERGYSFRRKWSTGPRAALLGGVSTEIYTDLGPHAPAQGPLPPPGSNRCGVKPGDRQGVSLSL